MVSKAFRGESGEVVRDFLSLSTFLTAVPVGGAALVLALTIGTLAARFELPAVVAVPVALTLLAPLTGLFAMAARTGATNAGFFEALSGHGGRGVLGFTLRYGILQAAWSVPLVLLVQAAAPWIAESALGGPGPRLTMIVWAAVAIAVAALVLPALSLLVATRTETVAEALSGRAWRWVISERGADLVPFLASAIGGMALFLLAALPPLAFVLPFAADISPRFGASFIAALPVLPWATAPILLGRLAGAFVGAEPLPQAAEPAPAPASGGGRRGPSTYDVPVPQASRTIAGLAGIPGATASIRMDHQATNVSPARQGGPQGVPLGVAVARAHQLAETDCAGALVELEELRASNPRNPAVVAELARVLRKAGRSEEALQAAATSIRLALSGGAGPIAHDVFRSFAAEAAQLNLEPAIYEQLARILCARREFDGAAWCYRAAAALGGDPKSLQKGMLAVAEAAVGGGHHEKAAAVYEAFLKTWPESPLARFARDGAAEALRKAGLATAGR